MLTNDPKITELMFESMTKKLSLIRNITLAEANIALSKLTFKEYVNLVEASADIVPPSGRTISPAGQPPVAGNRPPSSVNPGIQRQPAQTQPGKATVPYTGQGGPIATGMTVGLKGPNGLPVPGEITQVDQGASGVKVKNPTTGQEEWHNNDELEPFEGGPDSTPGATNQAAGLKQQMAEDLRRIKQLAGIIEVSAPRDVDHMNGPRGIGLDTLDTRDLVDKKYQTYGNYEKWKADVQRVNSELLDDNAELSSSAASKQASINRRLFAVWNERNGNGYIDVDIARSENGLQEDASAGASCASSMGAGTPQPLRGKIQRRSVPENSIDEYTPTVAKTVVGDTKPSQDSGKLSARLAKAGKPTASRINNGFKR